MRFLVDESTGPAVAGWLRKNGHDVFSVFSECRGIQDTEIIQKAFIDNRILVTNTNAIRKVTSPPLLPSPLEGEGRVGGKMN
jgi:predicted nuclease of predicted toxin-antitoxin system